MHQLPAGRITRIEPGRRPGYVRVYVEDRLIGSFAEAVWISSGLQTGEVVSPEAWEALQRAEAEHRAITYALRLLAVRARSEDELRRALLRKQLPASVVSSVLDRLRAWGYVDDRAFARQWVAERAGRRGLRALAYELQQKGLEPELIRQVLAEAEDPAREYASALALAKRRWEERLPPQKRRRRIIGLLARRGFSWEIIEAVVRALESET
jgi:regulatory protein